MGKTTRILAALALSALASTVAFAQGGAAHEAAVCGHGRGVRWARRRLRSRCRSSSPVSARVTAPTMVVSPARTRTASRSVHGGWARRRDVARVPEPAGEGRDARDQRSRPDRQRPLVQPAAAR